MKKESRGLNDLNLIWKFNKRQRIREAGRRWPGPSTSGSV